MDLNDNVFVEHELNFISRETNLRYVVSLDAIIHRAAEHKAQTKYLKVHVGLQGNTRC